jgi:hypothetical protein
VTSGTLALKLAEQLLVRCTKRQHNRFELNKVASCERPRRSALHKLEIKIKTMICLRLHAVFPELLKKISLSKYSS